MRQRIASMADCMLRNLQHFVERYLSGLLEWQQAMTKTDENAAEIEFDIGDDNYLIRCESPELEPRYPLGRVFLNDVAMGPIDQNTWDAIGKLIVERAPVVRAV